MKKILNVYKPVGITPLALIDALREEMPELKDEKIGYAGRLDPLAHGVMLLMIGEATKERDKYLGLAKTYEFEVLFGVATDSYDVLGIIQSQSNKKIVNEKVNVFVDNHLGTLLQSYPPYSSKPVNGKPLFWWARHNQLDKIEIPKKEITISQFEILRNKDITKRDLQKRIPELISFVRGDFRQKEIMERWEKFFVDTDLQSFETAKFRISCSSGTYIRSLVHELGQSLETGAIALDILRTKVGVYDLDSAEKLVIV